MPTQFGCGHVTLEPVAFDLEIKRTREHSRHYGVNAIGDGSHFLHGFRFQYPSTALLVVSHFECRRDCMHVAYFFWLRHVSNAVVYVVKWASAQGNAACNAFLL